MSLTLGTVMPSPKFTALDNNGAPISGARLWSFQNATSTPLSTYTSASLAVANSNPVICDSAGRALVFLSADVYTFRLEKADGSLVWSVDGVSSTALGESLVGVGGSICNFGGFDGGPITATTYSAPIPVPNSGLLKIDSASLLGSYVLRGMIETVPLGFSTSTTSIALINMTDAPTTPMVEIAITGTAPGIFSGLVTSDVIVFPAPGIIKTYEVIGKVTTAIGFGYNIEIVRVA